MPRISSNLAINARVSVTPHFLRRNGALETLEGFIDPSSPGARLFGTIQAEIMDGATKKYEIAFDVLPNRTFILGAGSEKYEVPRRTPARTLQDVTNGSVNSRDQEDPDLLEDAFDDVEEESEEEIDLAWDDVDVTVDICRSRPEQAFRGRACINLRCDATPAEYFLRFLPVHYIQTVVIPAITEHVTTVLPRWKSVTFPEYLTWIALFVVMTTNVIMEKTAYWHKSAFPFGPSFDFSVWMKMERFEQLTRFHVFEVTDAAKHAADKLYQIRAFLDVYNENLKDALSPGKHLCVDESMNQWLGHGMPNLKKIPRKPYSIAQEFKTIAGTETCCIYRLDITGDEMCKKSEDTQPKNIACVLRLTEPCSTLDDRSLQIPGSVHQQWYYYPRQQRFPLNKRPFGDISSAGCLDEYEEHKGAVDTANNHRDNMTSFHDVMKTYGWGMRRLAFFLSIVEANAFSAFKHFRDNANDILHFEFRWRLAQSLLDYVENIQRQNV
ncbi:hypothetical protein VTP01DRAFT_4352 [Rhizomucor pusillus]|uniref:uncharacterized protein n=1 Tax=Rhizomucor pusillus TaxID=4840 RepID=UPI003742C639